MMTVPVTHYLILSLILFGIGLIGLMSRKNILVMFMCVELLLNAANLAFIALARHFGTMDGHVVAFIVMAIAAAEAAIGLAIAITMHKNRQSVNAADWDLLKG